MSEASRGWAGIRRLGIGLGVLVGLGFAATRLHSVEDYFSTRVAKARLKPAYGDVTGDDAMHVIVCGSGSPLPSPERSQACVVVFAAGHGYVFDTGMGSVENITTWRLPSERIEHVFYTHFHSDHIADLYELNLSGWVTGRPGPLQIHGPPGVETVVQGFQQAYAHDRGYRVGHHGAELLPPSHGDLGAVPFEYPSARKVIHTDGEVTVSAFPVQHEPVEPAVGYRVDYRGRSVVISGDTIKSDTLIDASQGADLLLHEALAPHMVARLKGLTEQAGLKRVTKIFADIPDYHTSPVEAAEVANEAGVQKLVLYHLAPAPPHVGMAERIFLRGVSAVRSGVTLARDGSAYVLPVGDDSIRVVASP